MITYAIAPAEDGTGDVFVFGIPTTPARFLRLDHNGTVVPTFLEPSFGAEAFSLVFLIAPVLDGTNDLYRRGFTTYNGVPVNHIARIHADGSLASVVN